MSEKLIIGTCPQCGIIRETRKSRVGSICNSCRLKNMRGKHSLNWKGGIYKHQGYVFVFQPEHHRADKGGYVKRAVLVAETKIGRTLFDYEDTHHINGIKDDDRPENVDILTHSQHTSLNNRTLNKASHMIKFRWGVKV